MSIESAAPGILAIWNDREESIAEVYERWYLAEHLPERLGVPGFLAARRYEARKGSPRFFTFYDVESLAVLSSETYLARLAAPSLLTREVMANFRNMIRTACTPVYRSPRAGLGGCVVVAYVEQPARLDCGALLEAAGALGRDPRVLGLQAWQAAPDPAHAATPESKLRPGGDKRIEAALVVEVLREQDGWALEVPVCEVLGKCVTGGSPLHINVYRLLGLWHAERD